MPAGDLQLAFNRGFTVHELRKVEKAIITHLWTIIDQYQTYCHENGIKPATKRAGKTNPNNPALQMKPEFLPDLSSVTVTDTTVVSSLEDGRSISFPIAWSQKLTQATFRQRQALDNAHSLSWHEIDEIIGVRNILFGKELQ